MWDAAYRALDPALRAVRAGCALLFRGPWAAVRRGRSGRAAGEAMDGLAFSRGQDARSKSPAPAHGRSVHGWTERANRGGLLFWLLFSWPRKRKVTRAPAGARNGFVAGGEKSKSPLSPTPLPQAGEGSRHCAGEGDRRERVSASPARSAAARWNRAPPVRD